jgi:hypothetical protein
MNPIDPLKLQRLVDSEMDDKQVRQVLADAKDRPDHWREIAIGFVENQTWSRAFKNRDSSHETGDSSDTHPRLAKTQPGQRSTSYSGLVMAATVLVAATIGYMTSQIQNRNLPVSSVTEDVPPVSSPLLADNSSASSQLADGSSDDQPQMTQADYHLEVPEEHLGELASAGPVAPVPLYSINNVEQLNQFNQRPNTPSISPEILKQLAGSGYQMEQDVNYISGRLGDGRSFVVPVRTFRFLPGQ